MQSNDVREVYPLFGPPHLIGPDHEPNDTLDCWCGPRMEKRCTECNTGQMMTCFKCNGTGWYTVAWDDGYDPTVIVHFSEEQVNGRTRS